MSDAERLRREIHYLSGLIQKHKEGNTGTSARGTGTVATGESKYTWKRKEQTATIPSVPPGIVQYQPKPSQKRRKKQEFVNHIPRKLHRSSVGPTPTTMANKTGVEFDSKFKWTKNKTQTKFSTINTESKPDNTSSNLNTNTPPSSSSPGVSAATIGGSKPPQIGPISSSGSNPRKQLVKNTRYKYLKATSDSVASHTVKITNIHPQKSSPHFKHSAHQRGLPAQSLQKWPSKRHSSVYNGRASPSRFSSKLKVHNPYKLNRVTKSQNNTAIVRKLQVARSSRSHPGPKKTTKNGRKFDRRYKAKDANTHITLSKAALEGLLQKHSMTMKQVLANRAVVKSHETARFKKNEKSRQHCLYYGRFGKCMRGDSCKFIHDPSRIAVCTRFLRGTCRDDNCSFSHKVEKEKVPTCLFFLRGKCTAPNCPYRHVYLGKDAPICKKFATTGFCADADRCKMQHIKCCPEFYNTGKCQKAKACELPHLKIHKYSAKVSSLAKSRKSDEAGSSKIRSGSDIKSDEQPTTSVPSSPCPDFLSLRVDSPQPLNMPIKAPPMHIKPRFANLKLKSSSQ